MSERKADLSIFASTAPRGAPAASAPIPMPQSRWRTRVLLPALILALFLGVLAYSARDALLPATDVLVTPVVSKSVAGGAGSVSFQAAGWVEAEPFSSYASALAEGTIKDVLSLEGQRVTAGQIVATLVDDEAKIAFARSEAEVRQREAEIRAAESAAAAAQSQWDNPVERTRAVSVAENMLAENKAAYAKRESDIAVETARAEELKDQLQRETSLTKVSAVPEGQRIQTSLRLKTQEAVIEAAQRDLGVLAAKIKQQYAEFTAAQENQRLRIAEKKELESALAALQQSRAALEMAVAQRDDAQLRLQRMSIRAPMSGVVQERYAEPGMKMMLQNGNEPHSNHVLKIYDPEKLQVRVDVPLADAARVGVGQDVTIVVEVLRDTSFKGKVTRILHQADIQKNTLQVKVSIEKPAAELKPEMLARVQFIAVEDKGAATKVRDRIFAPAAVFQRDGAKAFVWIVDKGQHIATRRAVTLGSAHLADGGSDWIEVSDGLLPGDVVISGDTANLREGQRVRIAGETATAAGAEPSTPANPGASHGSH